MSSEKNQMPRFPFGPRTYVRTFDSGARDSQGSGGISGHRMLSIRNGVMLTQPEPSNVSTSSSEGSRGRMSSGSYRQWRKEMTFQLWYMTGAGTRSRGSGPGSYRSVPFPAGRIPDN